MKRWIKSADEINDAVGEDIIAAWESALNQCNLLEEEVHTLSYEGAKKLQQAVERELRTRGVDLSFKSVVLPYNGEGSAVQGMKVGGNVGGITNDLIRGCIKKAWSLEDMTIEELEEELEYAAEHDIDVYTTDKYGYCVPSTPDKLLKLFNEGSRTQYSGYGSQSYIDETTVKVYVDYFGKIRVDRSTVRYD